MSGIIKARDTLAATAVRSLADLGRSAFATIPDPPPADPRIAQLQSQLEQATARAERQAEEIRKIGTERDRARADGERAGRAAGRAEAEDRESERLEALEAGVEEALSRYTNRLASANALGRLLAIEGLKRLIGDDGDRIDLLGRLIGEQLRQIDAASIVRIEIARADFPSDEALDALRKRIGARFMLDVRDDAEAGDCRIVQTLGALEIGVGQQMAQLAALLGADGPDDEA